MKKYQLRTKTDDILNRFPALCKRLEGAERTPRIDSNEMTPEEESGCGRN